MAKGVAKWCSPAPISDGIDGILEGGGESGVNVLVFVRVDHSCAKARLDRACSQV